MRVHVDMMLVVRRVPVNTRPSVCTVARDTVMILMLQSNHLWFHSILVCFPRLHRHWQTSRHLLVSIHRMDRKRLQYQQAINLHHPVRWYCRQPASVTLRHLGINTRSSAGIETLSVDGQFLRERKPLHLLYSLTFCTILLHEYPCSCAEAQETLTPSMPVTMPVQRRQSGTSAALLAGAQPVQSAQEQQAEGFVSRHASFDSSSGANTPSGEAYRKVFMAPWTTSDQVRSNPR